MVHGHTVAAVIVAAGASRRMGFDKLAYPLDGGTVLEKSVRAFDTRSYWWREKTLRRQRCWPRPVPSPQRP